MEESGLMTRRTRTARGFIALAAIALVAAACSSTPGGSGAPSGSYKIGVSNTLQGNGWREEMICSIKAEAKASGKVSQVVVANRNTDTAGQLEDMRSLISAGVNAIIVNPTSADALNPVIQEATAKGIVVVAVDQGVTDPSAYVLSNDQENYGYLGAKWLFTQLGGKGDVIYMRGIEGVPADTDRDKGFKRALAEFPDIKVVKETFTGWELPKGTQQINDIFAAGTKFDGIWTSGIDANIVEAFKTANKDFVPIVGADNNSFVGYLDTEKANGLKGAAVTNPPPVGGAGVALALKVLNKETVDKVVKLTPEVWDNTTDAGIAKIKAAYDKTLDPYYGVNYTVPGWTTYSKADLVACKAPGE
jgi:ribose transport system substrate-binding protein